MTENQSARDIIKGLLAAAERCAECDRPATWVGTNARGYRRFWCDKAICKRGVAPAVGSAAPLFYANDIRAALVFLGEAE